MRFDKLTMKTQEILQGAMGLADKKGNPQVEPVHLLAVALQVSEEIARPIVGKLGANAGALAADIEAAINKLPQQSGAHAQPRPISRSG